MIWSLSSIETSHLPAIQTAGIVAGMLAQVAVAVEDVRAQLQIAGALGVKEMFVLDAMPTDACMY